VAGKPRAFGYLQRFTLAVLDEQALADVAGLWLHALTIAKRQFGDDPTPNQLESVRRVLRSLAADGLVEIRPDGVSPYESADWSTHFDRRRANRFVARIPLDQRDVAAARSEERRRREARERNV
jgi:hypothetical protein